MSATGEREARGVGRWAVRPVPLWGARLATRGALTPSPRAFRLPRTPHELAHALAHAARDPASPVARNYPSDSNYRPD